MHPVHFLPAADCPVVAGFVFYAGQDFSAGTNLVCNEADTLTVADLSGVCLGFARCTAFNLHQGAGDATPMSCLKSGNVTLAPNAAGMAAPCQGIYVRGGEAVCQCQ